MDGSAINICWGETGGGRFVRKEKIKVVMTHRIFDDT